MCEERNRLVWNYFGSIVGYHLPTGLHSVRVGESARLIGEKFHLDDLLLNEMGLLHDVGKIVVPLYILSLNDRAPTIEEFELIKPHTRVGYDVLKDVLPLHACIAGKHHPLYAVPEYPASLSVSERIFVDRCVSVITLCDFYDALMTRHNVAFENIDRRNVKSVREVLEKNFPEQREQINVLLDNMIGPAVCKGRIT